jgi:hypothetical protein
MTAVRGSAMPQGLLAVKQVDFVFRPFPLDGGDSECGDIEGVLASVVRNSVVYVNNLGKSFRFRVFAATIKC